ncbi:DUF4129 domain-containing protein [Thermodesulfobacteriota bacterium]
MPLQKTQHGKGTTEIIEEAVYLLRRSPANLLASYYVGSLPFVLGFLYFWADMSRNPLAKEYYPAASLGLAILFVWMKCWQGIFSQKIKRLLSHDKSPQWSLQRISRFVAIQTTIHSSGLLVLPLSLLLAFPFGWMYAFYQNVSLFGAADGDNVKKVCLRAWEQTKRWPKQNHVLVFVLFILSLFVFINWATIIYWLPHLLKNFIGIQSQLTRGGFRFFNTTFLTVTCGMTYLCLDPLVKTVYTLRCFYGGSLRSGDDLKTELKHLAPSPGMRTVLSLIGIIFFFSLTDGKASEFSKDPFKSQRHSVSPQELEKSIEAVMRSPEFTWRLPREKIRDEGHDETGPIQTLLGWIEDGLKTSLRTIGQWLEQLRKRIEKIFPKREHPPRSSDKSWTGSVRPIFFVLFILLIIVLVFFCWRNWRRSRKLQDSNLGEAIPSRPDLSSDFIKADDYPVDRWLGLAKELAEKGFLREALRALYLATLSLLAEREMITIAKYKTNKDYEGELRRRATEPELLTFFSTHVTVFDRVWYGMQAVTLEELNRFAANHERMTAFGQE